MRIDVKKFLLFGPEKAKRSFFMEAQKLGLMEFIDAGQGAQKRGNSAAAKEISQAMKILRRVPPMVQEKRSGLDAYFISKEIIQLQEKIEELIDQERRLSLEMARIAPFGNFSVEETQEIEHKTGYRFQFFFAKKKGPLLHDQDALIYISSDEFFNYCLYIGKERRDFPKMMEMKIESFHGSLQQKKEVCHQKKAKFEKELREMAKYSEWLHLAWSQEINEVNLKRAESMGEAPILATFAVFAWIPSNTIEPVERMAKSLFVHMEEVALDVQETPPTYLENHGLGKIGEDLVSIYDTPSPTDKDPSIWVLMAFILFFSFIVGDAGYGAVYLGLALFLRYRWPDLQGVKRRILNLATLLCCGCILWGLFTNSFFGLALDIDNPLRKFSFVQWMVEKKTAYFMTHRSGPYLEWVAESKEVASLDDPAALIRFLVTVDKEGRREYEILDLFSNQILLELALITGTIHVLLGMVRYLPKNIPLLGWILFVTGGALYAPYYLEAPAFFNYLFYVDIKKGADVGLWLMMIGFPLAFLLSLWKNRWLGFFEPMALIQIFADILSYLRLYALGLAGAIVAGTINELAAGAPLVVGFFLLLIAHPINMALGIMGGVIHGLRLNFLEWYHYSFEGNGKKFVPLSISKPES